MILSVVPVKTERKSEKFDIFEALLGALQTNNLSLNDGDVVVISSKYISNSQGRIIDLKDVIPNEKSKELSKNFQIDPSTAEVILRESDFVFGGISGFVITSSDNIMSPNAGIDKSNTSKGKVILYPNDPYSIAEQLRRKIFLKYMIHVGVILADSRLMPSRIGTTGICIACAGIEPVEDMRAQLDLNGNSLKVTLKAVVDNLAAIANYKMGEGSESKPIAIIKNSKAVLTDRKINPNEITISPDQCVYVRGLSSQLRN